MGFFAAQTLAQSLQKSRPMAAPLMVSISGIRGIAHESFTQEIIEKYTTAFGKIVSEGNSCAGQTIIVGRDSRISGISLFVK